MKKLPYGISNYEMLITNNYYYVDKTKYIEKLEALGERTIMFLRPRKFGKTLFTSTLEYYYDIKAKAKFDVLFKETYIGKHPTNLRNSYYMMKFNFSGIDTSSAETTIKGFRHSVILGIERFMHNYKIQFDIPNNQSAEELLGSIFEAFQTQKENSKIYVIIDEYDHFANELLGFDTRNFRELVSQNGKVRKWYEVLKKGTESVVDRIFITGVAPITLDSLTSGFNIATNETRDRLLNEMLGFTQNELIELMKNQEINKEEQDKIFPIMRENYDGYTFSTKATEKIYNSNMCLYFLNQYIRYREIPESLMDVNIASDYSKLGKMLDLCTGERRKEILNETLSEEGIMTDIIEKFNPVMEFGEKEFASMLFYLGYLTISGEKIGKPILKIPNTMMKEIYADFFVSLISTETNFRIAEKDYNIMLEEIALYGKIDKITEIVHIYLNNLSNRDFQNFDEKYVKLIFYCIAMNLKEFFVKSEPEVNRHYPDILIVPRNSKKPYYSVMVEFKYLKANEKNRLNEMQKEALDQIEKYLHYDEIQNIQNLHAYTIVAVNDKLYVEKAK